jgi:glutamyl-tRNA reductase
MLVSPMTDLERESPPLPLAVVGVDFRRAPARQRDRLLLTDDERRELALQLQRSEIADGLACLDTCNRTEWIATGPEPGWIAEVLRSQMISRDIGAVEGEEEISQLVPYVWVGADAARHLFEVAAGLESFVMGEHEITAQLHRALERSRAEQTASPVLNGVGKVIGRLTRDTHQIDLTGAGPRGVHDLAVDYLLTHRREAENVVVVGLGQIGEKVVRSLRRAGVSPVLCNRSPGVRWVGAATVEPLSRLPELLAEADGAIVCTAAPNPAVRAEHLRLREGAPPLLLLDLGIPAQVEPSLRPTRAEIADLETIQQAATRRQLASWADITHVRQRVTRAVEELEAFCQERHLTLLLRRTQERHQRYIRVEIPKVLDAAVPDLPPSDRARLESELKGLVRNYTNAVFRDVKDLVNPDPEPE